MADRLREITRHAIFRKMRADLERSRQAHLQLVQQSLVRGLPAAEMRADEHAFRSAVLQLVEIRCR